jgi:hypothetical protein
MLTIVNNVIHVHLLVQEKHRVSFMYFCTHGNINVFISTDRLSFSNNKISIVTGRPPISSIFNSMNMLFLSKLNLLQYNRKCSEHSFFISTWTNKWTCITLLTIVNIVYFYMYVYYFLGRTWGIDWLTCHKSMRYTCVIQFKLYLPMQYPHKLIRSQHINYV